MCRRVDATASWSGFNYQGKIGLYVVLKTINEENIVQNNEYELEFEWLEDFAIKNGNDYISVHQVKAKQDRYLNNYSTAINFLDTIVESETVAEDKAFLHVIRELNTVHNFLYNYEIDDTNQTFCPLSTIDTLIQNEIETFFDNNDIIGEEKESHFYKLLALLDHYVSTRHQEIHIDPLPKDDLRRNPTTIAFSDIILSLNENLAHYTNDRLLLEKKVYFTHIIEDYCSNKTEEEKTKVRQFQRKILALTPNEFFKFINNISPHESCTNIKEFDLVDFQSLLQKDSTKNPLIKSIQTIESDFTINYESNLEYILDGKCYLPTTISDEEDEISTICQKMIDNTNAADILRDKHYLINREIDNKTIRELLYNIIDVEEESISNPRFTDIQDIKFIKINTAKDKIDA